MELSEIINHLGEDRENYFNAVSPPIMQSSMFCYPTVEALSKTLQKEFETPFYTRGYNPTVGILRKKLAALENTEDALAFASGSAAIAAAVMSVVKSGDHAICVKKPYSWTKKLFNQMLVQYGVECTMVDGTDFYNFENSIQENTKLIFLESPNSMTFELQDIEAVCKLAKSKGVTTIIDNSYSTPLYQQPAKMGVDIVVHSASKYFGGHSDIVAGVLCASKKRIDSIFKSELMTLGGIISPNDAWLMIRGLRTLKVRLEASAKCAEKVIPFLENHAKVEKVLWPFSKNNPQYELAKKQMIGCGGLFSIVLKTEDKEKVKAFSNSLQHFLLTCSWGGYEALAFPICALYESQNYSDPNLPYNMVRLYVGLEEPELLIEDLERALERV